MLIDLGIIGLLIVLVMFPIRLLLVWMHLCGKAGTPRRKAMAAMMAVAFGYMCSYAFSQSFFLKLDMFPFFTICWITLLFTNQDQNRIQKEFPTEPA